jgi:hypothetical protein
MDCSCVTITSKLTPRAIKIYSTYLFRFKWPIAPVGIYVSNGVGKHARKPSC